MVHLKQAISFFRLNPKMDCQITFGIHFLKTSKMRRATKLPSKRKQAIYLPSDTLSIFSLSDRLQFNFPRFDHSMERIRSDTR